MSSSDPSPLTLRRWRIDLAYDGSSFHGFADQPGVDTVVGALRDQLVRALRLSEVPEVVGAGRTDAGVHALAQVVHCDLPEPLFADQRGDEGARLVRSLNGALRGRVTVLSARPAHEGFHARFSATWRAYRYLVVEGDTAALGFLDSVAWTVKGPLDPVRLAAAAGAVEGEHDFAAFCRHPDGVGAGEPLVRVVHEARWSLVEDQWQLAPRAPRIWRLDITANAFCRQMVRSLASMMVAVAQGRVPLEEIEARFVSRSRVSLPSPAPAAGLALIGVGYGQLDGGPSGFVS